MRKIILLMLLLAGCSGVPTIPGIGPYKIDIQQGNYVDQEMVAKLKPGMTRAQVRFILGTPLVVDMFRTNRWDYVYVYEKGGKISEQRKFTVIFEEDKLARVEGDVVAAGGDKAASGGVGADKPKPAPSAAAPGPETAATPAPAKAEGTTLTTTSGEPVSAQPQKADPARTDTAVAKPKEEKPREEKGFFGRMLDKIGF